MLWIDLKNAVENKADNFTCKLFQLMFKADKTNFQILKKAFPVEAAMVWIYKYECPYTDTRERIHAEDYRAIGRRAIKNVEESLFCHKHCKVRVAKECLVSEKQKINAITNSGIIV